MDGRTSSQNQSSIWFTVYWYRRNHTNLYEWSIRTVEQNYSLVILSHSFVLSQWWCWWKQYKDRWCPVILGSSLPKAFQWRHNERHSVSNHRRLHCLLSCWFRRISKKTSKPRVTGLCAGNSPATDEFPVDMPVTRKMLPFYEVILIHSKCITQQAGSMQNCSLIEWIRSRKWQRNQPYDALLVPPWHSL